MGKIGGTTSLFVDGKTITIGMGTVRVDPQMVERTGVPKSSGGAGGFTEAGIIPELEVEALFVSEHNMTWLQSLTDVTITVECANGKSVTYTHAFASGRWPVDNVAGTFTMLWQAESADWDE